MKIRRILHADCQVQAQLVLVIILMHSHGAKTGSTSGNVDDLMEVRGRYVNDGVSQRDSNYSGTSRQIFSSTTNVDANTDPQKKAFPLLKNAPDCKQR